MASDPTRWFTSPVSAFLFRLVVGIVFLYAGWVKGTDPQGFAQSIYNYRILPGWMINPVAIVLPWLELLVGAALLLGVWVPGASLLTSGLLAVFAVALGLNLVRGLDIACGCFSTADTGRANTLWYVLRDLGLLAMGLHVLFFDRGVASVAGLVRKRRQE